MVHFLATSPNFLCGSKRVWPLSGYLPWHNCCLSNFLHPLSPYCGWGPLNIQGTRPKLNFVLKLVKGKTAFWVWTGKAEIYLCIASQSVCNWPL